MLPFRRNFTTKTCFLWFRLFAFFCIFGAFSKSLVAAESIFVDDNASEGGDGSSWGTAYKDIRSALDEAYSSLDQDGFQNITIKVAEGVYKPTEGATSEELKEPQALSFSLKELENSLDRLVIEGGWRGDETSDDPQGDVNATILSGEIDSNNSLWSKSVVYVNRNVTNINKDNGDLRAGTMLKGFVISKWNANGEGRGINNLGSPRIENLVQRETFYVDENAADGGYGSSWASAYKDLRSALNRANSLLEQDGVDDLLVIDLNVAEGVYLPTDGATAVEMEEPRTLSFRFSGYEDPDDRLTIQGGWRGGEPFGSDPQGDVNATILSGKIDANQTRWSMHVLYADKDVTNNTLLKGFVITKGNANGFVDHHRKGGGMYNMGSPRIENCVFNDNRALFQGAGMANAAYVDNVITIDPETGAEDKKLTVFSHKASPFLLNCRFESNRVELASVHNLDELFGRNVMLAKNLFLGGGGFCNLGGIPTLDGCVFEGNKVEGGPPPDKAPEDGKPPGEELHVGGGGMYDLGFALYTEAYLTDGLDDVAFTGETQSLSIFDPPLLAVPDGQSIVEDVTDEGKDMILRNCLFSNNMATGYTAESSHGGGGLFIVGRVHGFDNNQSIINCRFTGNEANSGGGIHMESVKLGTAPDYHSNPLIQDCNFTGNKAYLRGGGVSIPFKVKDIEAIQDEIEHPTFIRCVFSENNAPSGGGIFFGDVFSDDWSKDEYQVLGGSDGELDYKVPAVPGLKSRTGCRPVFSYCVFTKNTATYGGGLTNAAARPKFFNCIFYANSAGTGGAVWSGESATTWANCLFYGNSADGSGVSSTGGLKIAGAVYDYYSTSFLGNCVFWNNTSSGQVGHGYVSTFLMSFGGNNFWIEENPSGATHPEYPGDPKPVLFGGAFIKYYAGNLLQGGYEGVHGIVEEEPLFADASDPDGPDDLWFTADDGFRPLASSPVVDAGRIDIDSDSNFTLENLGTPTPDPFNTNVDEIDKISQEKMLSDLRDNTEAFVRELAFPSKQTLNYLSQTSSFQRFIAADLVDLDDDNETDDNLPYDASGNLRVSGRRIDFGPYEFIKGADILVEYPKFIYVDDDAPEGGDGTSWATAYKYLRDALEAATRGDEIRVAEGVYRPTDGLPADITGDPLYEPRTYSFELNSSELLIGGWRGDEAGSNRLGNPQATILSGEINDNDMLWSLSVVTGKNLDNDTVLDGFRITKGNANGYFDHKYPEDEEKSITLAMGGGVSLEGSSPTIRNCFITGNKAISTGIWRDENSTLRDRKNRGGGMFVSGGAPTLVNCVFEDNEVTGQLALSESWADDSFVDGFGGGLYGTDSSLTLKQCVFVGNSAKGIFQRENRNGVYSDDWLGHNDGMDGLDAVGGGIFNKGTITLSNCLFTQNTAQVVDKDGRELENIPFDTASSGGAMFMAIPSNPTITNSIFWDNVTDDSTGSGLARESPPPFPEVIVNPMAVKTTPGDPGVLSLYPGDPNYREPTKSTIEDIFLVQAPNIIQDGFLYFPDLRHVIEDNPFFVDPDDPDGPDNIWFTEDDGLRLRSGSPGIDTGYDNKEAGYDEYAPLPQELTDPRGLARIQGTSMDIGPFEDGTRLPSEWETSADHGLGWRSFEWFGYYFVAATEWLRWTGYDPNAIKGWIYHADYGWLYRASPNIDDVWLWHPNLGWLWSNQSVFPYLYRADAGDWIYFHPPSTAKWEGHTHADPHDPPPPPVYYDFGTAEWLPLEN
jgi:hypothetical protein